MKKQSTSLKDNTYIVLLTILLFLVVQWLFFESRNLRNHQYTALPVPSQACKVQQEEEQSSVRLPIQPTVPTGNISATSAIAKVFDYTGYGGWINVNSLTYGDIKQLRDLGQVIMSRNVSCGRPQVFGQDIVSDLEFCFWENDFVSDSSLANFDFEKPLVSWVYQEFRDLEKTVQKLYPLSTSRTTTTCSLALLDAGVNVGDWASQLVAALPTTPFYGIEGTPSTGAIATANMRTSIEHRHRSTGNSNNHSATALLLPYSLLPRNMIDKVQAEGGMCYGADEFNVGGQGIDSKKETKICEPHLIAGGTLLSNALKSIVPLQSCPGKQDWPRVYLAKFDIQRFEFKVMNEALHWLSDRPPCYIMIEILNEPRTHALLELLLDIGYDNVWRTHNLYSKDPANEPDEFPPGKPFWTQNSSISLHEATVNDLQASLRVQWGNKDYLFGFEDKEKCIRRLME